MINVAPDTQSDHSQKSIVKHSKLRNQHITEERK